MKKQIHQVNTNRLIMETDFKHHKTMILRDYLLCVLKGISMYAHRTRQLSVTDRQIDLSTAQLLHIACSAEYLDEEQMAKLCDRASSTRDRARILYEWSCGPLALKPEVLFGPATRAIETDPDHLFDQALALYSERQCRSEQDTRSLEDRCARLLDAYVSRFEQALIDEKSSEIDFDFFHDVLDSLTADLSAEELETTRLRIKDEIQKTDAVLVTKRSPNDSAVVYH